MDALKLGARKGEVRGYALIRDKDGKPKIDNIETCPPEIWALLTEEEKEELLNGPNS